MSLFWNYYALCPCFETRFLENRVLSKFQSSSMAKTYLELDNHKIEFYGKLDFLKIEFYKKLDF